MRGVLGYTALGGFLLTLVVHVLALRGIDVPAHAPSVPWILGVGIVVVCIPFSFSLHELLAANPTLADVRAEYPGWASALCLGLFVYAGVDGYLASSANEGSPSMHDAKYVLQVKGEIIREITETEYTAAKANVVRMVSGGVLFFYFLPFAYYLLRRDSSLMLRLSRSGGR